jgi:hypothetical protein
MERSDSKSRGVGLLLLALLVGIWGATASACKSGNIDGTAIKKGDSEPRERKPVKNSDSNLTDDPGGGVTDRSREDPVRTSIPVADAGDASTMPDAGPNAVCAGRTGYACFDCCYAATPGSAAALKSEIDFEYSNCVVEDQCGDNVSCQAVCYQWSIDEVCRTSGNPTCTQLSACTKASGC